MKFIKYENIEEKDKKILFNKIETFLLKYCNIDDSKEECYNYNENNNIIYSKDAVMGFEIKDLELANHLKSFLFNKKLYFKHRNTEKIGISSEYFFIILKLFNILKKYNEKIYLNACGDSPLTLETNLINIYLAPRSN